LASLGDLARREGIAINYLKGMALYSHGIYAAGERPMADLDLLVRHQDLQQVDDILTELGYHQDASSWKHRSYSAGAAPVPFRLGEHSGTPVSIDLHTRLTERLPQRITDLTDLIPTGHADPGLQGYPTVAALMIHLLAHASGNMIQRELRLIQVLDLVRLSRRMGGSDWERVLAFHGPKCRLWWGSGVLLITSRYFPQWIPAPVLEALMQGCPSRLRRVVSSRSIADFSYSRLFHDPFPGLAWTRTYREMLDYLTARLMHAREQLRNRRLLDKTELWDPNSTGRDGSQTARLLRGFTLRSLRKASTRTVRAALELPHDNLST